jgi:Ca-activated chloride channel family protein
VRFELPLFLWLAPAVGLAAAAMAWLAMRRRVRLAEAWSPRLAREARRGAARSVALLGLAALAAALAAAGPRGGRKERLAAATGLNVLIAVDVSRSMLAEDVRPSRLRHAVSEARRLVSDLPGDRVGLVAFAGQSHLLSPLTLDHSAADLYLEALDPDVVTTGGTHLGEVLRMGAGVLGPSLEGGDRALVVFTDGEAHDSLESALDAARTLAAAGVLVIFVAEGGDRAVRIPLRDPSGAVTDFKRDADGNPVETRRRDDVFRVVAEAANGVVVPAGIADQAGAVRQELSALGRRPLKERRLDDLVPLGWVGALAAALVLLGQTAGRRGSALAVMALMLAARESGAQRQSPGHRLLERSQDLQAAAMLRAEALRGQGGDTAWYNAGTAAFRAKHADEARDALTRAAGSLDPGLRFRALYNLGLLELLTARATEELRAEREDLATQHFRQALLLQPGSLDAKWNLELLVRRDQLRGGSARQQRPAPSPEGPARPPPEEGLSVPQAEALLSTVARDELSTRRQVVRRQRLRSSASLKDW